MADAIDDDTVLIVGSAPSYPQGYRPHSRSRWLAAERGILCHVDACLGGFILPFLDRSATRRSGGPHRARGHLDLGRPPQVRVRLQGGLGGPLPHGELARFQPSSPPTGWAACMAPPRWPEPGPPVPSPPGGPSSTPRGGRVPATRGGHVLAATAAQGDHRGIPGLAVPGAPDATVFAFGGDTDETAGSTRSHWAMRGRPGRRYFDRQSRPTACTEPCMPATGGHRRAVHRPRGRGRRKTGRQREAGRGSQHHLRHRLIRSGSLPGDGAIVYTFPIGLLCPGVVSSSTQHHLCWAITSLRARRPPALRSRGAPDRHRQLFGRRPGPVASSRAVGRGPSLGQHGTQRRGTHAWTASGGP